MFGDVLDEMKIKISVYIRETVFLESSYPLAKKLTFRHSLF